MNSQELIDITLFVTRTHVSPIRAVKAKNKNWMRLKLIKIQRKRPKKVVISSVFSMAHIKSMFKLSIRSWAYHVNIFFSEKNDNQPHNWSKTINNINGEIKIYVWLTEMTLRLSSAMNHQTLMKKKTKCSFTDAPTNHLH